ncbi:MAG TPA: MBL fold metallo-hydrolase [Clostridia bacterium]|nr:MBL fold metallo-hydrolase [Clostridia bacterium]
MKKLKIETRRGLRMAVGKRSFAGYSLNTCSYWVDGVIVDTGPRSLRAGFRAFLAAQPVEKVVLTHSHEDHCGNAVLFNEKGIPVYLHPGTVDRAAQPVRVPFYRWVFWRPRSPFKAEPLPGAIETARGKLIQVIPAPGHAPDHVAYLYPEEGVLFTGDLFVSTTTKLGMREEDYAAWMNTLAKLLEYDFDLICCGHAGMVPNGKEMLAKKLHKLQELKESILHLKEKGWSDREIERKLFPHTRKVELLSGGEWGSIHIVRALMNTGK